MTREEFIYALHRIHAIRFGNFTLKSGQQSSVYMDLRQIISYPEILRTVASLYWQTLSSRAKTADRICGVPYTALPIATCLSLQHNMPMIMRRKEKKQHGTKQSIEGAFKPGQTCLIIEDIMTTGGSILETATDLQAVEMKVTDVAILIDRAQGGKENMKKQGFTVHATFTLREILDTLIRSSHTTDAEKAAIAAYQANNCGETCEST